MVRKKSYGAVRTGAILCALLLACAVVSGTREKECNG